MSKAGRRKNRIAGQFSARTIEMLESPAYRVLSLHAQRVLARLEIEHAHHAGNDNGRLPCTYDHFEEYGVRRKAIRPALRELEALGFIEITEQGRAGNAEWRRPNYFRLTYRYLGNAKPTDEWKRIRSREEAEMIAEKAWQGVRKNKSPVAFSASVQGPRRHQETQFHSAHVATTSHSAHGAMYQRSWEPA
jgi:DNA-binding transcriptional MocR family regulator